jgi:hypothetical protein
MRKVTVPFLPSFIINGVKNIKTILEKKMPKEIPKPMGRWSIEDCNKKTDNKIDLSNEDHCGPCGQYALSKTVGRLPTPPRIQKMKSKVPSIPSRENSSS